MHQWRTSGTRVGDLIRLDDGPFEHRLGHGWARGRLKQGDVLVAVAHSGDCFFDYILLEATPDARRGTLDLVPVGSWIGAYVMGRRIASIPDDVSGLIAGAEASIPMPADFASPEAGRSTIRIERLRDLSGALATLTDGMLDQRIGPDGLTGLELVVDRVAGTATLDFTSCTCLTETQDDAYGPGGPMSGQRRPPPCRIHGRLPD